ncbi:hypothetical protein ACKTEK_07090 [Tepidamorphus sp. 3E244]|uniref:hypothetical protein n=1 Tax=Tepidamorphus sp. 3E244 TaxID=3385498 RepID=UPI0038FC25C7
MKFKLPSGNRESYLDRTPERLVVEGYRHWVAGYDTGSIDPWELAWTFYSQELGAVDGRRAIADLSCFVRSLRVCAGCPLRSFPFGAKRMCREECLAAALISACQHGDTLTRGNCITCLGGCDRAGEIEEAARRYAATLDKFGQTLMPVPAHVIDEIAGRPQQVQYH